MSDSLGVYVLRRLLFAIPTLIGISFVTFVLLGAWLNPLYQALGPVNCQVGGPTSKVCSATIQHVMHEYHLDAHLVPRWWYWAGGLFTGKSGHPISDPRGLRFSEHIWPDVWRATGHTTVLIAFALLLVVVLSVSLGVFSARRAGHPSDVAVRIAAYSTWSIPAFLLALLLQQLAARLALVYHWQPLYAGGVPGPEAGTGFHFVLDWIRHLTLPVIALAVGFVGVYSRYLRSTLLVSLHAPYTTTARAKGVSERRLTWRHALRNSLIPFTNVMALDFGAIFGASLAVDYVFGQHGLASYLVQGLFNSDPYQVEPVVVIAAGVVLVSRVLADVVTAKLDPRVRLA
jgi:peptide/nickel transport system permease protein